ncbi:hypothetical protein [Mucilaginibacter sp. SJ]|uniref:hypothetical protein n=1 Tax=Mucilaginibacter sp. SJ TaxID=3029053 RepID=UPI0023A9575C|nr:hypothetical protein [Mucilaginibacter sp. SJ]WEA00666.1 hypothetical protein MusilaSJ_24735 [Mucilaginibacter sp. SJ]
MSIAKTNSNVSHQKLHDFLERWPIAAVENLTLEQYTQTKNPDTFTYWLEYGSEEIGILGGGTSSKFGIWNRGSDKESTYKAFSSTSEYRWFKKYGENPTEAFQKIKSNIIRIIRNAQAGNFNMIDRIDIDSMTKWKIAFIYSQFRLLPIYKIDLVRKLAKHFEYDNYAIAPLSELHQFILSHKAATEDFFDFSSRYFLIADTVPERNYYIIGSKYGDDDGNDTIDVFPDMLEKSAISTGFFWNTNFSAQVGQDHAAIGKWIKQNVPSSESKYATSARTFKYFLNLKKGDLIAVKSHGRFNSLTIIAFAEVVEKNGSVYSFGDPDLGHLIHVNFLETGLHIDTGLNYALTIHHIVPGERDGHFEKIFGSYAIDSGEEFSLEEEVIEEEDHDEVTEDEWGLKDDIRLKDTSPIIRSPSEVKIVQQVHNKIQNSFAQYLKMKFPDDEVCTERRRIDIWRRNKKDFFIYEVKPYNTAYVCIREALGQLTDYAFRKKTALKRHLVVVGTSQPNQMEKEYLKFLKEHGFNISYEHYDIAKKSSVTYA